MDIKAQVQSELIAAMKNKDDLKLQTLRLLSNAIHNEEIAKQVELTEADIQAVIKREVKKRKEASEIYATAGRMETAEKETAEAKILEAYLPEGLSEEEVEKLVDAEISANPEAKAGQIIGAVVKKTGGQADGTIVSKLVNAKLSK